MTRHNGRASAVWGSTALRGRGAVALRLRRLCCTAAYVWVPWLLIVRRLGGDDAKVFSPARAKNGYACDGEPGETDNAKLERGKTRRCPGRRAI